MLYGLNSGRIILTAVIIFLKIMVSLMKILRILCTFAMHKDIEKIMEDCVSRFNKNEKCKGYVSFYSDLEAMLPECGDSFSMLHLNHNGGYKINRDVGKGVKSPEYWEKYSYEIQMINQNERWQDMKKQSCVECGQSVRFGSGLYVNRIPVLDDYQTKVDNGRPFPRGEWICINCEEGRSDELLKEGNLCPECSSLNVTGITDFPDIVRHCTDCGAEWSMATGKPAIIRKAVKA